MSLSGDSAPGVSAGTLARLPSGRHGLPREIVASRQRDRLLQAVIAVVGTLGYGAASSKRIAKASGVSGSVFYEHFPSLEACLLAACDASLPWLLGALEDEIDAQADWAYGLGRGLGALLLRLAVEPQLARVWFVELRAADLPGAQRHLEAVERLAIALRPPPGTSREVTVLEYVIAGGVWETIARTIRSGSVDSLPELAAALHHHVLSYHLGSSQARLSASFGV